MGAIDSNSFNFPLDFPPAQNGKDSGTPAAASQGKGGPAPSSSGTSAYASLQGSGQTGQNVNATLGQALGTLQGSIADSNNLNSTEDSYNPQGANADGTPQAANAGLSLDQQVNAQHGSQGGKDSNTGDGNSENQDIYMGTAASGLQKGDGTQSASSIRSTNPIATFSLKVDSKESLSSAETSLSNYVDENKAPALPPGPIVFAMVAENAELSTQQSLQTIAQMVSANQGLSADEVQSYKTDISNIETNVKDQAKSNKKSGLSKDLGLAVDSLMIVVGFVTADPMLIAAGAVGIAMSLNPSITSGLTNSLEKMGIPSEAASMMSSLIIVAAASVGTMGLGAVADVGAEVATVAAREAITAAESGTEDVASEGAESATSTAAKESASSAAKEGTENATSDAVENATENAAKEEKPEPFAKGQTWRETANDVGRLQKAMVSPEGRAAFQTSLKTQMTSAAANAWKTASAVTVSGMVQATGDSITKGVTDFGTSAKEAVNSAMKTMLELPETMETQMTAMSKFFGQVLERYGSAGARDGAEAGARDGTEAGEDVATAKGSSMVQQGIESFEALVAKLSNADPVKVIQITSQLVMASLSTASAVAEYKADVFKGEAEKAQSNILSSQASATEFASLISESNSQIQAVLNDMNGSIASAGTVLSQLASLSQETLGQMHGAGGAA